MPKPLAKCFASLSESQLNELVNEWHSKKTKGVTRRYLSVRYRVIVALQGRFAKHSGKKLDSTWLSPGVTLTLLTCLSTKKATIARLYMLVHAEPFAQVIEAMIL